MQFLLPFFISFLASINAVMLNTVLGGYGVYVALGIFLAAFACDFASTVSVKNAKSLEANPVVRRLGNHFKFHTSLAIIGVISMTIQVLVYVIFDTAIVSYFIASLHLYAILSNLHVRKYSSLKSKGIQNM